MVCCWPQPAGASRQSVNVLAWAAIASTCPPGPRASVAAHLGSAGSVRHDAPGPARVAACVAFRMMPTEPPGPIAVDRTDPVRSGAELGRHDGATWTRLITARALAATPAAQPCQVTGLTAVAFGGASTFADWRLASAGWSQHQTIRVTIPYGSSG